MIAILIKNIYYVSVECTHSTNSGVRRHRLLDNRGSKRFLKSYEDILL